MPSNLLGSLYAAMSGLNAFTRGLDNLSDNVANLNTTGYKANDVFYRELQGSVEFGQGGEGGAQIENGQGVAVGGTKVRFTEGELAETGVDTDMAIDGNGLFVLRDGKSEFYTRAGEFTLDDEGYLVDPGTGFRVAKQEGGSSLHDINLREKLVSAAQVSTEALLRGTLNRTAVEGTRYPPEGAVDTDRIEITLYDNNGRSYQAFVQFTKQTDAAWLVELRNSNDISLSDPATLDFGENGAPTGDTISQAVTVSVFDAVPVDDVPERFQGVAEVSIADTPGQLDQLGELTVELGNGEFVLQAGNDEQNLQFVGTSTFTIDSEGYLVDSTSQRRLAARDTAGSEQFVDARIDLQVGALVAIEIDARGQLITTYDNGDRIEGPVLAVVDRQSGNLRLDFSAVNTADFVSSSVEAESVDGRSTGQLVAFAFESDGTILLRYSNSDEVEDGKIALALFSNISALKRVGDALFTVDSLDQRVLGNAESGAFGKIVHRSIERSNVELSREFAEIIIVQRGFQASSQVLNATNELIEELYSSTRGGR